MIFWNHSIEFDSHLNNGDVLGVAESQTDDILTGEPSTAAGGGESSNKTILSLRSWMDKTLHLIAGNINKDDGNRRVAITSDAYLQSALKIASCLARQIIQAQDSHAKNDDVMSVNDSLLLLPQTNSNGRDWTTYVTVQLGSVNEDNNELMFPCRKMRRWNPT